MASTVVGVTNRGPPSTALLISVNGILCRNVYKYTVAHAKIRHAHLAVIYHLFGKTYSVQHLTALASAIPDIWMGPPKFKMGNVM